MVNRRSGRGKPTLSRLVECRAVVFPRAARRRQTLDRLQRRAEKRVFPAFAADKSPHFGAARALWVQTSAFAVSAGGMLRANRRRRSAFPLDRSPRTNRRAAAVGSRHGSNSRSLVLPRERPSLISRSWFARLRPRGRDRSGRRCGGRPPWFLGLWRISCPLPDPGYAFPTARPFGFTERCAPWVGTGAKRPARASHRRALAHLVARTGAAIETMRPDNRCRSHRRMPERA